MGSVEESESGDGGFRFGEVADTGEAGPAIESIGERDGETGVDGVVDFGGGVGTTRISAESRRW